MTVRELLDTQELDYDEIDIIDGAEFKIQFNDGRVVVTHNLWNNGEIPEDRRIQNNAKFL